MGFLLCLLNLFQLIDTNLISTLFGWINKSGDKNSSLNFVRKFQKMKRSRGKKKFVFLNPPSLSAGNISIALPVKALAKIVKRCFISFKYNCFNNYFR
jgi:hypothetical protein